MAYVFEGGSFELGKVYAQTSYVRPGIAPSMGSFTNSKASVYENMEIASTGTSMSKLWSRYGEVTNITDWETQAAGLKPTTPPWAVSASAPLGKPVDTTKFVYLNSIDNEGCITFYTDSYYSSTKYPGIYVGLKQKSGYQALIVIPKDTTVDYGDILDWHLVELTVESTYGGVPQGLTVKGLAILAYGSNVGYFIQGSTAWTTSLGYQKPTMGEFFNDHFYTPKKPDVPINPDLPGSGGTEGEGGSGTGEIPDNKTIGVNQSYAQSGVLASGMVTAWKLDRQGLTDLASFLWQETTISKLKQMFTDPFDVIVSCRMYPGTGISTVAGTVKFGNIDSEVSAAYYTADAGNPLLPSYSGKFTISEVWGSFLDYAPLTKISIYLPYIGIEDLDPSQVVGKTINLDYYVNIVSGECIASLTTERQFIGTFKGQMGIDIPLTGKNATNQIIAAISAIGSLAITGVKASMGKAEETDMAQAALSSATTILQNLSPDYRRMNANGGYANWMMPQMPFLIITRPNVSNPADFQELNGYTSNISGLLEEFNGFTVCQTVHLDGVTATDREKDMIRELLQQGVIL